MATKIGKKKAAAAEGSPEGRRAAAALRLSAAKSKLATFSGDGVAKNASEYRELLKLRAESYAAHVAQMAVDPALLNWAERMAAAHAGSKTVKIWHNELPWIEALLVARYGEALEGSDGVSWPQATTIRDYGVATDWESGKEVPEGVRVAPTLRLG